MEPLVIEFDPVVFGSRTRDSDLVTISWSQSVLLRICVAADFPGFGIVELRRVVRGTKESVLVADLWAFAIGQTGGKQNCKEKWVLLDVANPTVELPGRYFVRAEGDAALTWIRGELQYEPDGTIPPGPIDDDDDTLPDPFPDPDPSPDPDLDPDSDQVPAKTKTMTATTVAVGVGAALLTAVVMAATIGRREP